MYTLFSTQTFVITIDNILLECATYASYLFFSWLNGVNNSTFQNKLNRFLSEILSLLDDIFAG